MSTVYLKIQAILFMFAYLRDAICARQQFLGMGWAWLPLENVVKVYCKLLLECNYRGVKARLFDHFIAPLYAMIFEQDLPCMFQEVMGEFLNIVDSYTSPNGTFIRMYNVEKALHLLWRFSMDMLSMQEVSYHSRHSYHLECTRRRRNHGLSFLCGLSCK